MNAMPTSGAVQKRAALLVESRGMVDQGRDTLELTARFVRAVEYAREIHWDNRKESKVPYMGHLLGVASLVLGQRGYDDVRVTEDMVIAALLHDVVEDAGGMARLHDIEEKFGRDVARMVEGCTDSFAQDPDKKEPWRERKVRYIERLPNESDETLLVSVADKLYNARATLEDYRDIGADVWEKFTTKRREDQLWYYRELIRVYDALRPRWRIVKELKRTVDELERISASESIETRSGRRTE